MLSGLPYFGGTVEGRREPGFFAKELVQEMGLATWFVRAFGAENTGRFRYKQSIEAPWDGRKTPKESQPNLGFPCFGNT